MAGDLQNQFRRAVEPFTPRIRQDGINPADHEILKSLFEVQRLLGVVKLVQGRFAEAEIHLKAEVDLNGRSDEALSSYGYALKALRRSNEALAYFTRIGGRSRAIRVIA